MPPSLSRSVLIVIAPCGEICLLEWTLLISKEEPLLTQKGQATEIQTKEYYDTLCSNLQGYTVFVKVKFSIDVSWF